MIANFVFSLSAKGLQLILGFAIIHHLVSAWGPARYGVWVTMTSLIAYTSMFDFGVGYGIKNKISEAHAVGKLDEAEGHARFGLIFYAAASVIILIIGLTIIPTIAPFNTNITTAIILWFGFVVSFFFSYANIILQALGRFQMSSGVSLLTPCCWVIFILTFNSTDNISPTIAASVYSTLLVCQNGLLAIAALSIWRFKIMEGMMKSMALARSLFYTGAKFFAMQLASLALFYSGTFLTYHFLGASEVARYDAANKVFSIFSIGFSMLISIAWTEISRAKSSRNTIRLFRIFIVLHSSATLLGVCAMLVAWFSPIIVNRLTNVNLATSEAMPFALLVTIQSFAFSSAVYLNAYERLSGQVLLALLSIPLFFSISVWLLSNSNGVGSIPMASCIALIPAMIFCFRMALRLIRGTQPELTPQPA